MNILVSILLLFCIQPCAVYGHDAYTRLYEDKRLDVTIALGFEQGFFPIVQDEENTNGDLNQIELRLLESVVLGLKKVTQRSGVREYESRSEREGDSIRVRVVYPDRNVRVLETKDRFLQALGHDDVIIYLGHSRDGLGFPDFGSPISNSGKVFFKNMFAGWMGFDRGYFSPDKYQILMIDSCKSETAFQKIIRQQVWEKAPKLLGLVLTRDDTDFADYAQNAKAFLEGLWLKQGSEEILLSLDASSSQYQAEHGSAKGPWISLFTGDGFLDNKFENVESLPQPKQKQVWDFVPY